MYSVQEVMSLLCMSFQTRRISPLRIDKGSQCVLRYTYKMSKALMIFVETALSIHNIKYHNKTVSP